MGIVRSPIRATILMGLAYGIFFIPAAMLLTHMFSWPTAVCLIIWTYLFIYGLFLTGRAGVSPASIIFPLLIPFSLIFPGNHEMPFMIFMIISLLVLSWIRSGICFSGSPYYRFGVEVLLSFGGGALAAFLASDSAAGWALGIWMFFLIQSVFFIFSAEGDAAETDDPVEAFEQARKRAEDILASESILIFQSDLKLLHVSRKLSSHDKNASTILGSK